MRESTPWRNISPYVVVPEKAYENAGIVPRTTPRPPASRERLMLRRPTDLPGVEHWHVEDSTRLWTVYHDTYAFCVADYCHGAQSWTYRRREDGVRVRTSTMLIEPGEVHVTTRLPLSGFRVLLLERNAVVREFDGDRRLMSQHFDRGQTDVPVVARAFLRACRAIEDADADPLTRHELLREFLFTAFATAGESPPKIDAVGCERAVMRTRDMLRARYAEPLTLNDVAAAADVSTFHLERHFHLRFGVPIHRFLKLVRLSEARRLLRRGLVAVEVAEMTGFTDSAHMTRVFRKELGTTPRAYAVARC